MPGEISVCWILLTSSVFWRTFVAYLPAQGAYYLPFTSLMYAGYTGDLILVSSYVLITARIQKLHSIARIILKVPYGAIFFDCLKRPQGYRDSVVAAAKVLKLQHIP